MKRKWTDPEILIPIIAVVISSILAPIILSRLNPDNSGSPTPPNNTKPINESPALSKFLGNWYYTDFYNTNPRQVPISSISINQVTEGIMQIHFVGNGNCEETCSYTGNARGNYSNGRINGSYVYKAEEYYFVFKITPGDKLETILEKDNQRYAKEYLVKPE